MSVTATYVGASSEVVESAVTIPLEQELNGVEGMRYISSTSSNDGVSQITITFEPTRDLEVAAVDVQNRVSRAASRLPAQVNQTGIVVNKASSQLLMSFGLYSPDERYDAQFLSNYADVNLRGRASSACAAWARCASSASASSPCACGWTPRSWRGASSPRRT